MNCKHGWRRLAQYLVLIQCWAIIFFALSGSSVLTARLLTGTWGARVLLWLLVALTLYSTLDAASQRWHGNHPIWSATTYMAISGVLLAQCFIMGAIGYAGVLLWLYLGLAIGAGVAASMIQYENNRTTVR